ncbi:DUF3576 domain-containing protein [Elioraea rosea]|uniref:DUF3576 domain-containing protein n=1 Tax=Elioraea rosea TaxID=2492390 RepID=UPI001184B171|nr:DUF3576 domain-containing protein [Elioraea rosea]
MPDAPHPTRAFRSAPACGVLLLVCGLVVAGCGQGRYVEQSEYNDPARSSQRGSLLGNEGVFSIFGGSTNRNAEQGAGALGVNAFLWRGSLDTLSFMPLVSADPFGGVIITDWYSPPETPGERFKVTVYILGRQLRSDGVRVSVFRQVENRGQWVDVPVSQDMAPQLEDKILARARDLRIQSTQTAGR